MDCKLVVAGCEPFGSPDHHTQVELLVEMIAADLQVKFEINFLF